MFEEILLTLNEASECIIDSRIMLQEQRWKAAVSRAYYAMFHSARAALLYIGEKAYTPQGVNIQFSKHFVRTGIFDKNMVKSFSKMLDVRQKTDYEIGFQAEETDAEYALLEAEKFHNEISIYLKANIQTK
jgi:uncharacterized protein